MLSVIKDFLMKEAEIKSGVPIESIYAEIAMKWEADR
jgi:hypothetical protein